MKISGIILGLLIVTTIPSYGGNETKQGLTTIAVLVAGAGTYVMCRRSYSKFDKICEVIGGAVLLAAGVAGVVLAGDISNKIERLYYK
jgi:glucokinase